MTPEEKEIEQIERFLEGKISGHELEVFESRMAADATFAKLVADYRNVIIGIDEQGQEEFSSTVAEWESEWKVLEQRKGARIIPLKRYWSIAAAILLFAVSIGYFLWPSARPEEPLFSEYFQPYQNLISERSDAGDRLLSQGMEAYDLGQYELAIDLLSQYQDANPSTPPVRLYLGVSYLAQGFNDQAMAIFREISNGRSSFAEPATWYLALTFLQSGDREQLLLQLDLIIDQAGNSYRDNAIALRDRL